MKTTFHDKAAAEAFAAKTPNSTLVETCLPLRTGYMPAWEVRWTRRSRVEGCAYCDSHAPGSMMPPHDASHYCKSGGHNHCTCDVCF